MRVAEAFGAATPDEIKQALDGGKLVLYSVGRPPSADHAILRSSPLATFVFASPAFGPDAADGSAAPLFVEPSVVATNVGTPGFARAFKADGAVVADFSTGPGNTEIKLSSISATAGYPLSVTAFTIPATAETVEWTKTEHGFVYTTGSDNPYRKLSVRG